MSSRSSRTLYVGNLPGDVREREVEDLFYKVNNLSVFLFLCNFHLELVIARHVYFAVFT